MKAIIKNKAQADPIPYPKLVQQVSTSDVYWALTATQGINMTTLSLVSLNFDIGFTDFDGQVTIKNA